MRANGRNRFENKTQKSGGGKRFFPPSNEVMLEVLMIGVARLKLYSASYHSHIPDQYLPPAFRSAISQPLPFDRTRLSGALVSPAAEKQKNYSICIESFQIVARELESTSASAETQKSQTTRFKLQSLSGNTHPPSQCSTPLSPPLVTITSLVINLLPLFSVSSSPLLPTTAKSQLRPTK